ncbi:MAG: poly-gamma-glutamate synthase PgsB [Polyangiales bacterium]
MIAILVGGLLVVLALGLLEAWIHTRRLRRIPVRIHVNGTRGKSSVTRLIAAGLRGGGMVTCAKTTGATASMIFPDGSEYAIFRPLGANIIEQLRVVRSAAEQGADALVVECMALQPLLQSLSELKLIRSTHGVITNVRPDHLDVMGPSAGDVALALAGTVPTNAELFTCETRSLEVLEHAASDRNSHLTAIDEIDVDTVTDDEMAGFSHVEHRANVALALRVCAELGVARRSALEGMWEARPDPGALTVMRVDAFGRELHFANAFAANDPESTGELWKMMLERYPEVSRRIALVCCRIDRPERSRQLGQACAQWEPADRYLLMGSGTYVFARAAQKGGIAPDTISIVEGRPPESIFDAILEASNRSTFVMGMGNTGHGGLELAQYFTGRGELETPR